MWKGCFIAIQDTGIIQQHPLSCQRDDAVPKPGDHLSISKGDRLPGDAKGKGREIESGPKEANGYSKSRESFITEAVSLCDSKPIKQLTPREIKKGRLLQWLLGYYPATLPSLPTKIKPGADFISSEQERATQCFHGNSNQLKL